MGLIIMTDDEFDVDAGWRELHGWMVDNDMIERCYSCGEQLRINGTCPTATCQAYVARPEIRHCKHCRHVVWQLYTPGPSEWWYSSDVCRPASIGREGSKCRENMHPDGEGYEVPGPHVPLDIACTKDHGDNGLDGPDGPVQMVTCGEPRCAKTWCDTCHPTHGPRCRFEDGHPAEVLRPAGVPSSYTDAQAEVVRFWQGYNVPAMWFYGPPFADGGVEVIVLGRDEDVDEAGGGWVWSIRIDADGETSTSEGKVNNWEAGIEI